MQVEITKRFVNHRVRRGACKGREGRIEEKRSSGCWKERGKKKRRTHKSLRWPLE